MFAVIQGKRIDKGIYYLVVDTDNGDLEWMAVKTLRFISNYVNVLGVADNKIVPLSYKEVIDAQLLQYKLLGLEADFELKSLASLSTSDMNVAFGSGIGTKNDFVTECFELPVQAKRDDMWLLWQVKGKGQLSLKLPWGISYITPFCFDYVHNQLQEVIIPKCCFTDISSILFHDCFNLERVVFNNTPKQIPQRMFESCKSLKTVTLPDTVERLCKNAFAYCHSLKSVKCSENLRYISSHVFLNCLNFELLDIPDKGLKHIGVGAFMGCLKLTNFRFPTTVQDIKPFAFSDSGLVDVDLSDCVLNVQAMASTFEGCKALKTYKGSKNEEKYESTFKNCTALESVVLPSTVQLISMETFENCSSLKNVSVFYEGMTTVFSLRFNAKSLLLGQLKSWDLPHCLYFNTITTEHCDYSFRFPSDLCLPFDTLIAILTASKLTDEFMEAIKFVERLHINILERKGTIDYDITKVSMCFPNLQEIIFECDVSSYAAVMQQFNRLSNIVFVCR